MIMPIYEYKCKSCGNEFELVQRITEDAINKCPSKGCDGEVFRKISKNVGLVFKGSGFYLTDYAKKHESAVTATHAKGDNGNGTAKKEETSSEGTKNGETKTTENKAKASA